MTVLLTRTSNRLDLASTSAAAAWMEGSSVTSIWIASTVSFGFQLAGCFVSFAGIAGAHEDVITGIARGKAPGELKAKALICACNNYNV